MERVTDLRAVPAGPLTIAAGQAACRSLDVPANVAAAAELVRRAAGQGADLLVLPELFVTGYELAAIAAEPRCWSPGADDPKLEPLAAACAQTRTAVAVGIPALGPAGGRPHISALVLGRDGRPAARYDKQHLDPAERAAGFAPGTGGCTIVLDGWRLGLGVCWDASYPEHARAAALDGCHAYLVGGLFDRARGAGKIATVGAARALDNACYVAVANHTGPSGPYHGCGHSGVWDPYGTRLADAAGAEPGLALAALDPALLAEARAGDLPLADPSLGTPARPRTTTALT